MVLTYTISAITASVCTIQNPEIRSIPNKNNTRQIMFPTKEDPHHSVYWVIAFVQETSSLRQNHSKRYALKTKGLIKNNMSNEFQHSSMYFPQWV